MISVTSTWPGASIISASFDHRGVAVGTWLHHFVYCVYTIYILYIILIFNF